VIKVLKLIPYIYILYGIFFFNFLKAQSKDSLAYIKIKNLKYDFGTVTQGKVVKIEYYFENKGESPLVISNIETTCGCTVADFPHYPVRKGDSGIILITFNTKEFLDKVNRFVNVISNASNSPVQLKFVGNIVEDSSEKKK